MENSFTPIHGLNSPMAAKLGGIGLYESQFVLGAVRAPGAVAEPGPPERREAGEGEVRGLFGVPFCGQLENPGVAQDDASLVDYSQMTGCTPDQARIEVVLESIDLRDRRLLHVGIGNSSLALRCHGRCRQIDGITLSSRERDKALALKLANYRALCANKYGSGLPAVIQGPYDFIIDNNLASFACCGFHLLLMFSNYRLLLNDGGQVLTDQQGMDWVVRDVRWRLRFNDLVEIGRRLSMNVVRVTDTVYAMIKA